jgi:hypothetical protein
MTRRMSSRRVVLPVSFMLLAAGGMAACDSASEVEDGHFYCTNAAGEVINEDYCDEGSEDYDSSMFFMYMGSSMHAPPSGYQTYPRGSKLPAQAPKFSITDKASRSKFGLPASGRVANGTVKTGVVGKGGAGSSVKGGGSGGGKAGG